MLNRIQTRALLLVVFLMLAFLAGLVLFDRWQGRQMAAAVSEFGRQQQVLLQHSVALHSRSLQTFAGDYSHWDEMLSFVASRDPSWTHRQLIPAIGNYSVNYLWIVDDSCRTVFQYNNLGQEGDTNLLPSPGQLRSRLNEDWFVHFYLKSGRRLIEIYGAPVQPQSDVTRGTEPAGWLFAGHQWTDRKLREVAAMVSGKVELDTAALVKPRPDKPEKIPDKVVSVLVLEGWSGRPVGTLRTERQIPVLKGFADGFNFSLLLAGIAGILALSALALVLIRQLDLPVRYLLKSLTFRSVDYLNPLRKRRGPYVHLSRILDETFRKETMLYDMQYQKRLEHELKESEQRYRLLVENNPDALWIADMKGEFVYISPNVTDMLGCSAEEIQADPSRWMEKMSAPDREAMQAEFRNFLQTGLPFEMTYHIRHEDGRLVWIRMKASSVYEIDGVTFCCGKLADVTEMRETQRRLFESEQDFKTLFDLNPFGVVVLTLEDLSFLRINKAFLRLTGYDAKELEQIRFSDLVPGIKDYPKLLPEEKRSSTGLSMVSREQELITKEGVRCWIDVTAIFLLDNEEVPQTLCAVIEEITQKKKFQDALQQEHDLLHAIMDRVPDVIYFKDQNGKYLNVNQAGQEYFHNAGLPDPVGKSDEELYFDQELVENIRATDRIVFDQGLPVINDEQVYYNVKTGEPAWFLVTKIPVRMSDRPDKILVGLQRNITQRKEAEMKLLHYTHELKALNASKDKFLSILAHDLKNPFNALLGFSAVLVDEYDQFTEEERKHFIQNIHHAADNTFNLVQNILDWSRAQMGRIAFNPDFHDISLLIEDIGNQLKNMLDDKEVRLISLIPANTQIYADVNMMRIVLRNLISNALKFSKQGGSIILSARDLTNDILEVVIEDKGIGIPEEAIPRLFAIDDSYRRDGTSGEQGTGLGLIICREFVERNAGLIWVNSVEGEGSRFHFTVPMHPDRNGNKKQAGEE